jgi:hypothetical protein
MRDQEVIGLYEAYSSIYAPTEVFEDFENYNEVSIGVDNIQAEEYDLYDYIMDYLISEGYANNPENAVAIMSNMSEDWRQNIVEVAYHQQLLTTKGGGFQNFGGRGTPGRPAEPSGRPVRQPFVGTERLPRTQGPYSELSSRPTSPRPAASGQLSLDLKPRNPSRPTPPSSSRPSPGQLSTNRYRPGATIRSTGSPETYRKHPELERTNNPRSPRDAIKPAVKALTAVAALRNLTPFGVAAAVSAPRPTADATLRAAPNIPDRPGQVKKGQKWFDYNTRVGTSQRPAQRLKVGQGIVGPKLSSSQEFDKAYGTAKQKGGMGSKFDWKGKSYSVY